jgi:hypothetical protein
MPLYDFEDKVTGEIVTKMIKISDKDQFLKDNPNLKQVILSTPSIVGSVGGTLSRAGDGWKEVQDKIKSGLPPRLKDNIRTK